jgi:hypothetical protein
MGFMHFVTMESHLGCNGARMAGKELREEVCEN